VLKIDNETSLPDGGPLSVSIQGMRGIDIGRDRHLDWSLPDPSRAISGKHCEIRYQDGGYVLFDVSTNGTFLDGKEGRLKGPHRLRNGDRLIIGHYIIGVAIDGLPMDAPAVREVQPTAYNDLWNDSGDAAAPVDRSTLRTPRERPRPQQADFLDWATDVPDAAPPASKPVAETPRRAPADEDSSWASGPPRPRPIAEPPPPMPEPRRPLRTSAEAESVWAQPTAARAEPPQAPPPPTSAGDAFAAPPRTGAGDLRGRIARAAGIPETALSQKSEQELADELGALMRLVTEHMRQLLKARLQAKGITRSANQTTIQALDNNPLKFAATTKDALEVMLGPQTKSYLDAHRAFEQGFNDIKSHQLRTFTAMQQALTMLVNDLDPKAIDKSLEQDSAITKLVGSRKAKLWDAYVSRWQSKTSRFDGGLLDAFMEYFAQCYDRNQ
jgi:type VI secretion system protein ImpI